MGPVESSISKAYWPFGRDEDGVKAKEVAVNPLPIVETVWRFVGLPFFNRRVTGPEAPLHVRLYVLPAERPAVKKLDVIVN